jgi:tetrahydromethanopterin S-methyltransferase subunit H
MPATVDVDDLTNVGGTGVFDKLMDAINTNINLQYENNRISGSDYANVYLGSIQAAMAQAVQFVLQEQVTEAQVDTARADIDVKERLTVSQLEAAYTDRVIKDKTAAKLGLDNAMKLSEDARDATPGFIYVPNYVDV